MEEPFEGHWIVVEHPGEARSDRRCHAHPHPLAEARRSDFPDQLHEVADTHGVELLGSGNLERPWVPPVTFAHIYEV